MSLKGLRRRLVVIATLWLCVQAVSLSAFAVNLCCLDMVAEPSADNSESHHHGAEAPHADGDCAEAVVDHCPMAGANGQPCPMHAGKQSVASTVSTASSSTPSSGAADCAMRGTCDATDIALLAFLWAPGVLVPPTAPFVVLTSQPVSLQADAVFSSSPSVDTPPPRR